jgi:hypothetical protein
MGRLFRTCIEPATLWREGIMRKFLLLAVILLGVVSAYADPVTFDFIGWSGGNWQNGYPYYVSEGVNDQMLPVMCDDYAHGGDPGQTWQANITDLGTEDVSLTRFGHNADDLGLAEYRQAGWILLQTLTTPMGEWKDMNEAVWHIFDSAAPIDSGGETWLALSRAEERLGFPGVDFGRVYIITPLDQYNPDPTSIQEFLYIGADSSSSRSPGAAPEPGTLVLLGTGSLALIGRKFLS